ncbi:MAG: PQQ-dependent sugar dehydrogenase [Gammaproteobacteria bacterium]|nr:PQQ-dependent sugar dehydrogenase [Gammaproteobacteria bacterium]
MKTVAHKSSKSIRQAQSIRRSRLAVTLCIAGLIGSQLACAASAGDNIASGMNRTFNSTVELEMPQYRIETVASGLNHPWSIAFLPSGELLVTERTGALRLIEGTTISDPVAGVPQSFVGRQGGLFDVALHPGFAENQWVYLSQAFGNSRANATRLVRGKWTGDSLTDVEEIFTAQPLKSGGAHFGARFVFLPDSTLLLSVGDGYNYREEAQRLDNHFGKIVRVNDDGSVPSDNPFTDAADVLPEIWSYGHRNAQAIVVDTAAQRVYANEHGPKGGDEINWIGGGQNYGWPIATYGIDYSGAKISPYTEHVGTTQPLLHWTPSIAPGGMTSVQSELFPQLNGDLLVAALKAREVRRVRMDGDKVIAEQVLFKEIGERIRDIRVAPDGSLYLLTDSPQGKVLRIVPET